MTIGEIEFFGTGGIDVQKVREALAVREGQEMQAEQGEAARQAIQDDVRRVTGKPATDASFTCCDREIHWIVFIGLSGTSTESFAFNEPPQGKAAFPPRAQQLYEQMMAAVFEAIQAGRSEEDDSRGYALSKDPKTREKQLAIRTYAPKREDLILRVLEQSSIPEQRQTAAWFLGYTKQSSKQVEALARAGRDPDNTVRNNAVRALEVLAGSNPRIAAQIPPENFVGMLCSGSWTDRNKSSVLLLQLTATRNPKLLAQIRAQALPALIEMAKWRTGHAYAARVLLGRIGGIQETRLRELADRNDQVDVILKAVQTSSK